MSKTYGVVGVFRVFEIPQQNPGCSGCGCLLLLIGLVFLDKFFGKEGIIGYFVNNGSNILLIVGVIVAILAALFVLGVVFSYLRGLLRMMKAASVSGCLTVLTSLLLVSLGCAGVAFLINRVAGNPLQLTFGFSDIINQVRTFIEGPGITLPAQVGILIMGVILLIAGAVNTIYVWFLGSNPYD